MRIERISRDVGEDIVSSLEERRDIDGTFRLVPQSNNPARFSINPVTDNDAFRVIVGRDRQRGWITLLVNCTEAIVLLEATIEPVRSAPSMVAV